MRWSRSATMAKGTRSGCASVLAITPVLSEALIFEATTAVLAVACNAIGLQQGSMIGQRFGRLVVQAEAGRSKNGDVVLICECECGGAKHVTRSHLRRGHVRSCGCLRHGESKSRSPEYVCWTAIKQRCTDPNRACFKNYGERGITVCERWANSFTAFLQDMGRKPTPRHVIDRYPDGNGNYEPGNCRWATYSQSNRNRRPLKTRGGSGTGLKGVQQCSRRSWTARICHHGEHFYIGRFPTPEAAHAAYCEAAKRLHGEFFCDGKDREAA